MASTTMHSRTSSSSNPSSTATTTPGLVSFYELDRSLLDTADNDASSSSSSKSARQSKSGMFSKLMHRMRTTLHHATGSFDITGLTGSSGSSSTSDSNTGTAPIPRSPTSPANRSRYSQNSSLPDVAEEIIDNQPIAIERDDLSSTASASMSTSAVTPTRLRITPPAPLTITPLDDNSSIDHHDNDYAASPDSIRSTSYFGFNNNLVNLSGSLISSGIKAVSSRYTDRNLPTSALANEVVIGTPTTTTINTTTAIPRPPSLYGIHAPSTTSLSGGDFADTYGELGISLAGDSEDVNHQGLSPAAYSKSTTAYYSSPMGRTTSASRELRRIRGEGISRDYWIKDEYAKYCYKCHTLFSTLVRRHHCRVCGLVFCYQCVSNRVSGERYGHKELIRVCDDCMPKDDGTLSSHNNSNMNGVEPRMDTLLRNATLSSTFDPSASATSNAMPFLFNNDGMMPPMTPLMGTAQVKLSNTTSAPYSPITPDHRSTDHFLRILSLNPLYNVSLTDSQKERIARGDENGHHSISETVPFGVAAIRNTNGEIEVVSMGAPLEGLHDPIIEPYVSDKDEEEEEEEMQRQRLEELPAPISLERQSSGNNNNGTGTSTGTVSRSGSMRLHFHRRASLRPGEVYHYKVNDGSTMQDELGILPLITNPHYPHYPHYHPHSLSNGMIVSTPMSPLQATDGSNYPTNTRRLSWVGRTSNTGSGTSSGRHSRTPSLGRPHPYVHHTAPATSTTTATSANNSFMGNAHGNTIVASPMISPTATATATTGTSATGNVPVSLVNTANTLSMAHNTTPSTTGNVSTAGTTMRKSASSAHRRTYSNNWRVELSNAAISHIRQVLQQLLQQEGIEERETWEDVMMHLLLKLSSQLYLDVRAGDEINICEYVKIKRIPGGQPKDSQYVNGIVCTKNLAHKRMARELVRPRILALTFPLQYQRSDQQFLSLEPIMAQERQYLEKLVHRIAALQPTLVLVQNSVSRIALEFLMESGIAVAVNVKSSVIDAVVRATRADVISSIDKLLMEPRTGTCGRFSVRTFVHPSIPGQRRSYLFFEDCPPELGGTIVLRGATPPVLQRIKHITNLMVFMVYNLKLETCLLRDQFLLTAPLSQPRTIASCSSKLETEKNKENNDDDNDDDVKSVHSNDTTIELDPEIELVVKRFDTALVPYKNTILSISPFVHFPPPFLLERVQRYAHDLMQLKRSLPSMSIMTPTNRPASIRSYSDNVTINTPSIATVSGAHSQPSSPVATPMASPSLAPTLVHDQSLKKPTATSIASELQPLSPTSTLEFSRIDPAASVPYADHINEYDFALNNFVLNVKAADLFLMDHGTQPSLFQHQQLTVLYSVHCYYAEMPCRPAYICTFEYYRKADYSLGQYLEQTFREVGQLCHEKTCERPQMMHYRSYTHGSGRVRVSVAPAPDPLLHSFDGAILMWSECRHCHQITPVVPMSDETWKYSFGKYLELSFYQTGIICRAELCPHDVYREHIRHFRLNNFVIRFEYEDIELLEIAPPPTHVRILPETMEQLKQQEFEQIYQRTATYWDSVTDRIRNFVYDAVPLNKREACRRELHELARKAATEKLQTLQMLRNTNDQSHPGDAIALNLFKRELQPRVMEWEKIFTSVANNYLQPERDLKRATTTQIRRLFADRGADAQSSSSNNGSNTERSGGSHQHDMVIHGVVLTDPNHDDNDADIHHRTDATLAEDEGRISVAPELGTTPTTSYMDDHAKTMMQQQQEGEGQDSADYVLPAPVQSSLARRISLELMQDTKQVSHKASTPVMANTSGNSTPSALTNTAITAVAASNNPAGSSPASSISSSSLPITAQNATSTTNDKKPMLPSNASLVTNMPSSLDDDFPFFSMPEPQKRRHDEASGQLRHRPTLKSASTQQQQQQQQQQSRQHRQRRTGKEPINDDVGSDRVDSDASVGRTIRNLRLEKSLKSRLGNDSDTSTSTERGRYSLRTRRRSRSFSDQPKLKCGGNGTSGSGTSTTKALARTETVDGSDQRRKPPKERMRRRVSSSAAYGSARNLRRIGKSTIHIYRNTQEAAQEDSDDELFLNDTIAKEKPRPAPIMEDASEQAQTVFLTKTDAFDVSLGGEEATDSIASSTPTTSGTGNTASTMRKTPSRHTRTDSTNAIEFLELGDDTMMMNTPNSITGYDPSQTLSNESIKSTTSSTAPLTAAQQPPSLYNKGETMPTVLPSNDPRNHLKRSTSSDAYMANNKQPHNNRLINSRTIAHTTRNGVYDMPPFDHMTGSSDRVSLVRTIASFWAAGANSGHFAPLEYPIPPTEHMLPDSLVHVRLDEPSSIIAYALSSKDYQIQMEHLRESQMLVDPTDDLSLHQSDDAHSLYDKPVPTNIQEQLTSANENHFKIQFVDQPFRFYCKIFYADQFDALRRNCGFDRDYIDSIARSVKWSSRGGKSGAAFLKTRDDRLIMKQLSRAEADALLRFAPSYFEYMSRAFFKELETVMAKLFGFYRIGYKDPSTGESMRMDVIVMENLFYNRKPARVFDLKGSVRNRKAEKTDREDEVLLDEDLIQFIYENPLFIREHAKAQLHAAVWNDTLFLSRLNVMDYSLLVGIDKENGELIVGIVDFIRTFTWDKRLESWVKETGLLGGGSKEPTIVTPFQYKKRFRTAMERYFLMVPDKYYIPTINHKGTPSSFGPPPLISHPTTAVNTNITTANTATLS